MRVFLTGATCFIGSAILQELLTAGMASAGSRAADRYAGKRILFVTPAAGWHSTPITKIPPGVAGLGPESLSHVWEKQCKRKRSIISGDRKVKNCKILFFADEI
jgi:hypothetical protein